MSRFVCRSLFPWLLVDIGSSVVNNNLSVTLPSPVQTGAKKSTVERNLSVKRYHMEDHLGLGHTSSTLTGLRKNSDRLMDWISHPAFYAGDPATLIVSQVGLPEIPFIHP